MNNQIKRYIEQGLGGSRVQKFMFSWNQTVSPFQYIDIFTNQKAPLSFNVQTFYMGCHYISMID